MPPTLVNAALPPDPFAAARPLLHWTGKRGGATTLRIMRAMEAARTGHVVDLWNPEGSLALTYESGAYMLTEQALVSTPWRDRVEQLIERLAG